jgi:hypothetical protein
MVKFFGFVLAMSSLVGSANAALLSSWTFDGGSQGGNAITGNVIAGEQGGNFSGNEVGYTGSSISTGATGANLVRTAIFYLQAADLATAKIDKFTFDALRGTSANPPLSTGVRNVKVSVAAAVGTGTPDSNFVFGSNVSGLNVAPDANQNLTATYNEYEGIFSAPVSLASNQILRLTVTYTGAAGTTSASTVTRLDNMQIYGSAVPEPASMAVFGLLGAGVAVRRLRRRA